MKKRAVIIKLSILVLLLILLFINKDSLTIFLNNTYVSFNRTIIEENRYKLLLDGLKATLLISLISVILGSILAIIICIGRLCKIKEIKRLSKVYISLLQGTPITVLLLIFYYVIFASVNINPLVVSIIAFSIYISAYVSEIYRGAYESIRYVLIPQMLTYIIPVYKNEIVAAIKLTSIVGFISVIDLTRASELIRNRTYEAFFPLIFTAIVYYLICFIVSFALDFIYKKLNKKGDV